MTEHKRYAIEICGICGKENLKRENWHPEYLCDRCKWYMNALRILRKEERVLVAKTFLQSSAIVFLFRVVIFLAFELRMEWSLGIVFTALFYYILFI